MAKTSNPIQKILPLFASLFIVVGVAAVALSRPNTPQPVAELSPSSDIETVPSSTALTVYQHEDQVHIVGNVEPRGCPLPHTLGHIVRVTPEWIEIESADHVRLRMGFDCVMQEGTLAPGLPNAQGTRGVRLGNPRSDGTSSVIISDGTEDSTIILRSADSRPYGEGFLIGWIDDTHIAATAFQGDARHLLVVEPSGRVMRRAILSEAVGDIVAGGGYVWYVAVTPGRGIEFGPMGPSELHRVDPSGKDEIVAGDEGVFERLIAGPDGRFAVVYAGGALMAGRFGETEHLGTGHPVGWTADGSLLVRRQGRLNIIDVDRPFDAAYAVTELSVEIPEGVTRVWHVPLDVEPSDE